MLDYYQILPTPATSLILSNTELWNRICEDKTQIPLSAQCSVLLKFVFAGHFRRIEHVCQPQKSPRDPTPCAGGSSIIDGKSLMSNTAIQPCCNMALLSLASREEIHSENLNYNIKNVIRILSSSRYCFIYKLIFTFAVRFNYIDFHENSNIN